MGAVWVVQADYTNIYLPDFSFLNPMYREYAVDTQKRERYQMKMNTAKQV
jgi:hypothetical protein